MLKHDRINIPEGTYNLIKPAARVSVLSVITGTFLKQILDFNQRHATVVIKRRKDL